MSLRPRRPGAAPTRPSVWAWRYSERVPAVQMRPLNFGEILDVSIKIFTRNAATLLKLVALIIIPVQVVSALILASTMPDVNDASGSFFAPTPTQPASIDEGAIFREVAGFLVTIIIGFIGTSLATAATYKAVGDAYLGGKPGWRESMSFGLRRLHSVIWVTLLTALFAGLILAGVGIAVVGTAAIAGEAGGIILGILAFFAAIPLLVWLYFSWSVSVPALLTEGRRGTQALRRSFGLVRGRWWFVFGVQVVASLVATVVSFMITAVPQAVLIGTLGDSPFAFLILQALATSVAAILTTPFVSAVAVVIYFDLRVRKEGFDLQLLAQNMGVDPGEGASSILPPPPQWGAQPPQPYPGYPPPGGYQAPGGYPAPYQPPPYPAPGYQGPPPSAYPPYPPGPQPAPYAPPYP
ncbi:MAG: hypothetical protein M3198_02550, partial [Actinomycetota bacterium]|nr:hypothetical protein [Actinomycetota bacterium]